MMPLELKWVTQSALELVLEWGQQTGSLSVFDSRMVKRKEKGMEQELDRTHISLCIVSQLFSFGTYPTPPHHKSTAPFLL